MGKMEIKEPKDISGFVNRTAVNIMTSKAAAKLLKQQAVKDSSSAKKDKTYLINRKPPFVVRGLTTFAHRPINKATQTDGYGPHAVRKKCNAVRHEMRVGVYEEKKPKKESRANPFFGLFSREKKPREPQISDTKRHKYRISVATQTPAVYRGRRYLIDSQYKDSNLSLDPPHLMKRRFRRSTYTLRNRMSSIPSPYPRAFQSKKNLRTLTSDDSLWEDSV